MSGIEVAGLVLGAIPICKLALNGINQTTSTINRFRKWRDEIPRYVTDLELVRIRLRHSLRLLFSLCGRELPDLDHLEQDQTGLVWKDEDVARDLRQNHSDIYIPVERDVLVMQELLEVLCKKLGLGFSVKPRDLKTSWQAWSPNAGIASNLKDRLSFSVSGNQISDIINRIKARQHDINETLIIVDILARQPTPAAITTYPEFTVVRKLVGDVHIAFDEALKCTAHKHNVRLMLDLKPGDLIKTHRPSSAQAAWSFRLCVSSTLSSRLCFAEVTTHEDCMTKSTPIKIARPGYSPNLCLIIQRPVQRQKWLGLVLDTQSGARLSGVYQSQLLHGPSIDQQSFVSFHQLLQNPLGSNGRPWGIRERHRRLLSTRVPIHALVLVNTAWQSELWRGSDIEFLKNTVDDSTRSVDLERPFVTYRPATPSVSRVQPRVSAVAAGSTTGADVTRLFLLRLCLLLMEIGLGETVEMYRPKVSMGVFEKLGEFKLLALLGQWKQERSDDLSPAFHKALEFCLISFMTRDFSLKQNKHLSSAIEKIVLPLTEEYEAFAAIT